MSALPEIHYGWARLSVKWNRREHLLSVGLSGFAYESEPNTPIVAGQTKEEGDANSAESGDFMTGLPQRGLGALALGATGAPSMRTDK